MIHSMKIENLKSINALEINCKKYNLITGINSAGKSSILQAILLAYQNCHRILYAGSALNGELVSIGSFREVRNVNARNKEIRVLLQYDTSDPKDYLSCTITGNDETDCECLIDASPDIQSAKAFRLKYLSCNRIGAQDVYQKNYVGMDIGINGEYAADYLEQHKTDVLDSELIKDKSSETLFTQVNYWLDYILGTTIATEGISGTDLVKVSYTFSNGIFSRPKNVGSGISYLLGILVLGLSAQKNDTLIIENPEIHLHPRAQAKVCEFLYFIAHSGRQLFVETHSDHLFNGIRAGIATDSMDAREVGVFFLNADENRCTVCTEIQFGKHGRILNYEDGLFDQFDMDLNKMLGL